MIENMLHKHRYFGHSGEIHECRPWSVTTVTPMKRGLKECIQSAQQSPSVCYNRYPDEKGTESLTELSYTLILESYNRYPDEKGTESKISGKIHLLGKKLQPLPR